jgi:AcrR family transcriptional regulator
MKHSSSSPRKIGRPLSFDRDAVLEKAMRAFWESGYETTSISDLTAAMGVTAPSIYAAFGDKKGLFLEALRRYAGDPADLEKHSPAHRLHARQFRACWRMRPGSSPTMARPGGACSPVPLQPDRRLRPMSGRQRRTPRHPLGHRQADRGRHCARPPAMGHKVGRLPTWPWP